ncbi:hypothetical protein K1719_038587 [Acacia pycnantha]|nr:hypothetical protein K1719_038587 [Acacia pycnantha]
MKHDVSVGKRDGAPCLVSHAGSFGRLGTRPIFRMSNPRSLKSPTTMIKYVRTEGGGTQRRRKREKQQRSLQEKTMEVNGPSEWRFQANQHLIAASSRSVRKVLGSLINSLGKKMKGRPSFSATATLPSSPASEPRSLLKTPSSTPSGLGNTIATAKTSRVFFQREGCRNNTGKFFVR